MTTEATPGALGSNDQLGPCPCCGHAAGFDVATGDDEGGHFVACLNPRCGISTPLIFACGDDPKPLLRERWNRRKEADKAERRAVMFGDIVASQVIAMRAAVVAAKLEGLDVGMQWIANTLCGPGHLPDIDEARALGGAQALWDKETAEQEAFRAAHPAPGA
jgi:hypothetical protein